MNKTQLIDVPLRPAIYIIITANRLLKHMKRQALTIVAVTIRVRGTHDMGICLGHASMTMSSFCLFWVKSVPSEEDSASCEVLAGLIQSLIAVNSANYAFFSKPSFRQPLKNRGGGKKFCFFVVQKNFSIRQVIVTTHISSIDQIELFIHVSFT